MVLELPTEVVDVLVSYIDDPHTLCSCSLTCRRWLPASRFHLFRNLSIPSRASYDILVRLRDAPHISPSFANIYSLQLWEDPDKPWLYLVPLIFAQRLTHVRLLTLLKFRWHEFPLHPSFFTIGFCLASITSLTLVGGTFHTFTEFRRLVCAFGHLTELIVERVAWRNPPMYSRCAYHAPSPRLQLLWLNSGCESTVTSLVDWLLCTPSARSIRDLQLGNYGTQSVCDMTAAQRLTAVLGPVLENYELSLRLCAVGMLSLATSVHPVATNNLTQATTLSTSPETRLSGPCISGTSTSAPAAISRCCSAGGSTLRASFICRLTSTLPGRNRWSYSPLRGLRSM